MNSMKIKKIILIFILVILVEIVLVGITKLVINSSYEKEQEQIELDKQYLFQYLAFCLNEDGSCDEKNLLIRLHVYNLENADKEGFVQLTIQDAQDFLSKEHIENGSYSAINCSVEIQDYISWYIMEGGAIEVNEYCSCILDILAEVSNKYFDGSNLGLGQLTLEQMEEIMKYKDNPGYEIDLDVF